MLQWEQRYIALQQAFGDLFVGGGGLEKFEVVRLLGAGQNGMVLQCRVRDRAELPVEYVAVKLMLNYGVPTNAVTTTYRYEHAVQSMLRHPNVAGTGSFAYPCLWVWCLCYL